MKVRDFVNNLQNNFDPNEYIVVKFYQKDEIDEDISESVWFNVVKAFEEDETIESVNIDTLSEYVYEMSSDLEDIA